MTSPSSIQNCVPSTGPAQQRLAGSYGRRSNPNEEAVSNQHAANTERATADGWTLPDATGFRFGDDATSGETTSRDGFDALLALVTSGQAQFDRLYIRERGRLARASDPRFIFWVEYTMHQHGILVCYSQDKKHVDYGSELDRSEVVGSFVTSAVENVNTHSELRAILARTKLGTRTHVTKRYFVGARAPFATERWLMEKSSGIMLERVPENGTIRRSGCAYGLKWREEDLPAVRRIYGAIENGMSVRAVAEDLTARGMSPPTRTGWSANAVWRIARNPLYKGDYYFGRSKHATPPVDVEDADLMGVGAIYVRGLMSDPPVSGTQWDIVQRLLDGQHEMEHKRRASRPEYLLPGILRCAACGGRLHGHTQPQSKGRVRMYRHDPPRGKNASPCEHANRYLRAQPLEDAALGVTQRCLDDDVLTRLARAEIERQEGELQSPSRAREITAERNKIAKLERTAATGARKELEAETEAEGAVYAATVREVSAELAAARTRLASLESAEAMLGAAAERLPRIADKVADLRAVLSGNTPQERKRVVAALIEAMLVDFSAERVEIRVRASDGGVSR